MAKARKAAGLSQRDLAKALGVSNATVAMYELGLRTPPGPVLVAMAELLGVNARDLVEVNAPVDPASGL